MVDLDSVNLLLTILSMIIFWICAVLFWIKSRKSELKSQKLFFIGVSGFFILWGIMRIAFTIANYYFEIDLGLYEILWKIAAGIGIAAILCILLVMETYMVKSKYIFSIITLIGLVLSLALPVEGKEISGGRLAAYIFLPIGAVSILFLYLYLYIKLTGKTRHVTGVITGGLTLIFLGYILNIELIKNLFGNPGVMDIIASIVMISGGLIYTIMYYMKE